MHSLRIVGNAVAADGIEGVVCHHNGDWSGDAIIEWTESETRAHHEVAIPAVLLLELSKGAALAVVADAVTGLLEQLNTVGMRVPGGG